MSLEDLHARAMERKEPIPVGCEVSAAVIPERNGQIHEVINGVVRRIDDDGTLWVFCPRQELCLPCDPNDTRILRDKRTTGVLPISSVIATRITQLQRELAVATHQSADHA